MNLNQAENLANALIREHLPAAWGFSWNRKRRAFGTCITVIVPFDPAKHKRG